MDLNKKRSTQTHQLTERILYGNNYFTFINQQMELQEI